MTVRSLASLHYVLFALASLGCTGSGFTGSTTPTSQPVKKSDPVAYDQTVATPTAPAATIAAPTTVEQNAAISAPAIPTAPQPAVAIGADCLSTVKTKPFSCKDMNQAQGGLIDALVGVRVILLKNRLTVDNGSQACVQMGGEMIATGDFFANPVADCIADLDAYWVEDTSAVLYKHISVASVKAKFGSSITNSCITPPAASNNGSQLFGLVDPAGTQTIGEGDPQDPDARLSVVCIFPLN